MTYSIILREGKKIGIGVVSGSIAVGSRVPWVKYGTGGVATQGYTNVDLGPIILNLLKDYDAERALNIAISQDPLREKRQIGVMDAQGNIAVFTGTRTPGPGFYAKGNDILCLGNLLKGREVVDALCQGATLRRDMAIRILNALSVAHAAGGDARGDRSAAIIIAGRDGPCEITINLRVDMSKEPVTKLWEIYRNIY